MKRYALFNMNSNTLNGRTYHTREEAETANISCKVVEVEIPRTFKDLKAGETFKFVNDSQRKVRYRVISSDGISSESLLGVPSGYTLIARGEGFVILSWSDSYYHVRDGNYEIE